jgi:putative ABC transport system ATP-binding protein
MIKLEQVSKAYRTTGRDRVHALHGIDLTVTEGEMVAVMGPSGAGTSTLMNILSCLDLPTEGRYLLDGADVSRMSKRRLAKLRGRKIGFVFQSFDLISDVTVQRNVELPLIYTRARVRRQRARLALDRVGLRGHYDEMPIELFAAQRQKAVIARALINEPAILLDDEPTSDLDSDSASQIMELFTELNDAGCTIIYATHEEDAAAYASRVVRMRGGHIVSDRANTARRRPRSEPPRSEPPRLRAV